MPRIPSLPHSIITAQLNRVTSLSGLVPYSTLRKSAISKEMARDSFASTEDLQRRARNAPSGAFLAIDFVMVPHAGRTMEGVNYHYSGQAQTRLGHQFTSAALVRFGEDPVPLLERFKVSQPLETTCYPYRTATQEMIHVVQDCLAAGVPMAGLLLDGEFGRDAAVTFSREHQIPVLIRAKATMTVQFEGESLTLGALSRQFPPERCHLYAEFGWRVRRLSVAREVGGFDVLIVWRKVHGEWTRFFLFSTFGGDVTVRSLLRAWKARWGIEVIHRFFKQNLGLGRCHCRTIQAQENWVWCVVEAFHAVLRVRREGPGMTWRAAQRQAAQNAEQYVLTGLEQDGPLLDAA
ncbi:transposase [Deinococcus aquaticus]|uniref:transposase n=2 Tax=Deinococcus aquaticus TaxID=328692 RepID=UPI003614979E